MLACAAGKTPRCASFNLKDCKEIKGSSLFEGGEQTGLRQGRGRDLYAEGNKAQGSAGRWEGASLAGSSRALC